MSLLVQALIEMFVILQPRITKLVGAGIDAASRALELTNRAYSVAGMVAEIILGVDRDYPDKPVEEKRQMVKDAVKQYILNHGGTDDPATIDKIHQAGVNYLLGIKPEEV